MKKILAISLLFINNSTSLFSAAAPEFSLTFATCAEKGNSRAAMEDCHYNDGNNQFFGVYDGHGGSDVAQQVQETLHTNIFNFEKDLSPKHALEQGFLQTHRAIENPHQGTTATVALIRNETLYVANVGDSRAVLCANGQAIQVSVDHSPDYPTEKERIEKLGVKVTKHTSRTKIPFLVTINQQEQRPYESARVGGGLAVGRALGDLFHEGLVIPNPDIHVRPLDGTEEFLIIACDGLWDVMSNQVAVDLTKQWLNQGFSVQQCTDNLVKKALNLFDHDNVTVTIIQFNHGEQAEPSALESLQEYSSQII